jgi:hypothetical protein
MVPHMNVIFKCNCHEQCPKCLLANANYLKRFFFGFCKLEDMSCLIRHSVCRNLTGLTAIISTMGRNFIDTKMLLHKQKVLNSLCQFSRLQLSFISHLFFDQSVTLINFTLKLESVLHQYYAIYGNK